MAEPLFFAPLREPLIDPRTGQMSRQWYLFFFGLWQRTGGNEGVNVDDLMQDMDQGIAAVDVLAVALQGLDGISQLPADVAALRDQVAELTKAVQGLQQGPII